MAGKKQFDMDTALGAAIIQVWRAGYADTSVDDLSRATGLNRSSICSSLGDKDTLFLRCLDRYAERYGDKYDAALSCAKASASWSVNRPQTVSLIAAALPTGTATASAAAAAARAFVILFVNMSS